MKKFVPLACTAILAAALMASPASAGVTGAGGGTSTTNTNRTNVYTDREVSNNTVYLPDVIRDMGKRIVSYTSNSVTSEVVYESVNGREYGWTKSEQDEAIGHSYRTGRSLDYTTSYDSFLRTSIEQVADNLVNQYWTKVGTTFDHSRFDSLDVANSTDLIVVGDIDNMESQYVAQGNRTITWNWTDFYWNDLNRTDVREKIFNKYQDYNRHTTYYYTVYKDLVTFVSPIVLNMDGSGKLMASRGQHQAHEGFYKDRMAIFDFYGSGEPKLIEWVGPKDGLLCVPKADGRVDGTCLFGIANGYENGYEELAATRDANHDGVVSGTELDGLYVWQDANGNALAGSAELKTVQELGITEIRVDHRNFQSSFTMNGATCTSWDWWPSVKGMTRVLPPQS